MKIILYRAGWEGVGAVLPGENPEMELADLLGGGEVEMTPITRRLMLVTAADAEKRQLPVRYAPRRMGRADEPVCGDCAMASVRPDGSLGDAGRADLTEARDHLRSIWV